MLALLLASSLAGCPVPDGTAPSLGARSTSERLTFIRGALERDALYAKVWTYGWISGLAVASNVLGVMGGLATTPSTRAARWVAAGQSLIPITMTILQPLTVIEDQATLRTLQGDDCETLARAERFLAAGAASERGKYAVLRHVVPVVLALGAGTVLGLLFGDWVTSAVGAGLGIATAELQTLTQPTGALQALQAYQRGALGGETAVSWQFSPLINRGSLALGVRGTF